MSDLAEILDQVLEVQSKLLMRIAEVERRGDNQLRHGKVTDVDAKKQRVRIEIGERDGKPVKSPWVPYGQFAGDYKHHTPPTKGQQLSIYAPNGEFRQAVVMPFTWSDNSKSPSEKEDEHVTTYGDKYRLVEKKESRAFTLDKTKQVFTRDKITTTVNGGNTPKDGNGSKADEGDQTNNQEAAGSSISQEEKKIVNKVADVSRTMTDKQVVYENGSSKLVIENGKITLSVGGSSVTIEDGEIIAKSRKVITDGETYLGSKQAEDQVVLTKGPATKVYGI